MIEEVLDAVRKIVYRWVNAESPITSDISPGQTTITVRNNRRFSTGDQVMLRDATRYETDLVVDSIDADDPTIVYLQSPGPLNPWTVSQNTLLVRTIYEMFLQGIYIGEPSVIPQYPAITVNGLSRSSEWLTLDSTKERYEIEVVIYVLASTHEKGYRFIMRMADAIQRGLKRNIYPLVDDYNVTSLQEGASISNGDLAIRVEDVSLFDTDYRIILEDNYTSQENKVSSVTYDSGSGTSGTLILNMPVCGDFSYTDTNIIQPNRFIYNSWPSDIKYGTIHKGDLLKAASISWFAEEEEIQTFRRRDTQLK